jgi:signal transduction histidine kinase
MGHTTDLWARVPIDSKRELAYVLQELMVNMRKHSGATLVTLSFDEQTAGLEVVYSDNGTGFPQGYRRGTGLKNTGNRIQGIGGTVTFGNKEPNGARVHIVLPFS